MADVPKILPAPWRCVVLPGTNRARITAADGTHIIAGMNNAKAARIVAAVNNMHRLAAALRTASRIADEAREEWDKAPDGMRAGKLLLALSGHLPGYRADIDEIFAALAAAEIPDG